ncbi:L-seryl-tRNA(Sec) selenium transferase [Helicobacter sp. 11S03491-1]|uniref:L-seryl-tRNA(Sec) selenium transferase n=1 Tax=Helicobacter sp. 11S03491-1 TaxID=1476196 RepID=UPI000BA74898|nr:L-seryl-tRNA(Sec) selenium transferase [Helicobacter sp. 11S03491-1]PAF43747.1 L-seryl-tRNA(Sec) selenium transferase [Helicobacter sp. 11S03491-1]
MRELRSQLPKIDTILKEKIFKNHHRDLLKKITQDYIQTLRQTIINYDQIPSYEDILQKISKIYKQTLSPSLYPIINATGVIAQTNLGRSVFSPKLLEEILPLLSEYNNLEYDIQKGTRGERYKHIKNLVCALFECEDVLVVNNNASAVLLIINTFAKNKEVIISRGELIEIGGSFRIPEVIVCAGGILKEVGSTNKTHLKDYKNAITHESALILKAHKSNFKQIGFTQEVSLEELILLAQENNLIDYYDVGSGYITGIPNICEPSLIEIAKHNPSLVSFSGDKLLGGPQAGIIFGKKDLIAKLKENHLLRALRVDKFTIFALQATFRAYLENKFDDIPTIAMLNQSLETLFQKAQDLLNLIEKIPYLKCEVINLFSKAGGGSLPDKEFPSWGVSISHSRLKAQILGDKIRQKGLIGRIQNEQILLDMRCIQAHHLAQIYRIFIEIGN